MFAVWCWARYRRVFTALRIITISHDSVEYMNMANQRHSDESDWIPNRSWTLSDCQCVPRHLDSHREKTTGTSWALTLWLCCSWNNQLVRLARGELVPRLSLISPKVFFFVLSPMEFWFLAAVASDTSFPVILSTWLHKYYLNWTEHDDDITECHRMPLTEKWAFNLIILH